MNSHTVSLAAGSTPMSAKVPPSARRSPDCVRLLVRRQTLRLRYLRALARSGSSRGTPALDCRAASRYAAGSAVESRLLLRRHRPVLGGPREVRRALEDGELGRLTRDDRDRLDGGGAGADHRDALAGEVDAVMRPSAGVVRLALEALGALDVGRLRQRQAAAWPSRRSGSGSRRRGRCAPARATRARPSARRSTRVEKRMSRRRSCLSATWPR